MKTRFRAAAMMAILLPCLAPLGCQSQPRRVVSEQLGELAARQREAEQLAEQADQARKLGNSEKAIALYRQSIEAYPDLKDVWNNLGLLLLEQEAYDGAISAFATAAELDPTDTRPITNMGIAYLRTGYAELALENFHKALSVTPSYLPALRGAIRSADLLTRAEPDDLERVKRALLAENDEQWRAYLERQRFVIEQRLRSEAEEGEVMGSATPAP